MAVKHQRKYGKYYAWYGSQETYKHLTFCFLATQNADPTNHKTVKES